MNLSQRREWITEQLTVLDKKLLEKAIERNGLLGIPLSPSYAQRNVILPPYKEGEPYLLDTYYQFDVVEFLGEEKD